MFHLGSGEPFAREITYGYQVHGAVSVTIGGGSLLRLSVQRQ